MTTSYYVNMIFDTEPGLKIYGPFNSEHEATDWAMRFNHWLPVDSRWDVWWTDYNTPHSVTNPPPAPDFEEDWPR